MLGNTNDEEINVTGVKLLTEINGQYLVSYNCLLTCESVN